MRTITKSYVYTCDAPNMCVNEVEIPIGDAIPAYPGALYPNLAGTVRTAIDADKIMRRRYGWTIGSHYHECDIHKGNER